MGNIASNSNPREEYEELAGDYHNLCTNLRFFTPKTAAQKENEILSLINVFFTKHGVRKYNKYHKNFPENVTHLFNVLVTFHNTNIITTVMLDKYKSILHSMLSDDVTLYTFSHFFKLPHFTNELIKLATMLLFIKSTGKSYFYTKPSACEISAPIQPKTNPHASGITTNLKAIDREHSLSDHHHHNAQTHINTSAASDGELKNGPKSPFNLNPCLNSHISHISHHFNDPYNRSFYIAVLNLAIFSINDKSLDVQRVQLFLTLYSFLHKNSLNTPEFRFLAFPTPEVQGLVTGPSLSLATTLSTVGSLAKTSNDGEDIFAQSPPNIHPPPVTSFDLQASDMPSLYQHLFMRFYLAQHDTPLFREILAILMLPTIIKQSPLPCYLHHLIVVPKRVIEPDFVNVKKFLKNFPMLRFTLPDPATDNNNYVTLSNDINTITFSQSVHRAPLLYFFTQPLLNERKFRAARIQRLKNRQTQEKLKHQRKVSTSSYNESNSQDPPTSPTSTLNSIPYEGGSMISREDFNFALNYLHHFDDSNNPTIDDNEILEYTQSILTYDMFQYITSLVVQDYIFTHNNNDLHVNTLKAKCIYLIRSTLLLHSSAVFSSTPYTKKNTIVPIIGPNTGRKSVLGLNSHPETPSNQTSVGTNIASTTVSGDNDSGICQRHYITIPELLCNPVSATMLYNIDIIKVLLWFLQDDDTPILHNCRAQNFYNNTHDVNMKVVNNIIEILFNIKAFSFLFLLRFIFTLYASSTALIDDRIFAFVTNYIKLITNLVNISPITYVGTPPSTFVQTKASKHSDKIAFEGPQVSLQDTSSALYLSHSNTAIFTTNTSMLPIVLPCSPPTSSLQSLSSHRDPQAAVQSLPTASQGLSYSHSDHDYAIARRTTSRFTKSISTYNHATQLQKYPNNSTSDNILLDTGSNGKEEVPDPPPTIPSAQQLTSFLTVYPKYNTTAFIDEKDKQDLLHPLPSCALSHQDVWYIAHQYRYFDHSLLFRVFNLPALCQAPLSLTTAHFLTILFTTGCVQYYISYDHVRGNTSSWPFHPHLRQFHSYMRFEIQTLFPQEQYTAPYDLTAHELTSTNSTISLTIPQGQSPLHDINLLNKSNNIFPFIPTINPLRQTSALSPLHLQQFFVFNLFINSNTNPGVNATGEVGAIKTNLLVDKHSVLSDILSRYWRKYQQSTQRTFPLAHLLFQHLHTSTVDINGGNGGNNSNNNPNHSAHTTVNSAIPVTGSIAGDNITNSLVALQNNILSVFLPQNFSNTLLEASNNPNVDIFSLLRHHLHTQCSSTVNMDNTQQTSLFSQLQTHTSIFQTLFSTGLIWLLFYQSNQTSSYYKEFYDQPTPFKSHITHHSSQNGINLADIYSNSSQSQSHSLVWLSLLNYYSIYYLILHNELVHMMKAALNAPQLLQYPLRPQPISTEPDLGKVLSSTGDSPILTQSLSHVSTHHQSFAQSDIDSPLLQSRIANAIHTLPANNSNQTTSPTFPQSSSYPHHINCTPHQLMSSQSQYFLNFVPFNTTPSDPSFHSKYQLAYTIPQAAAKMIEGYITLIPPLHANTFAYSLVGALYKISNHAILRLTKRIEDYKTQLQKKSYQTKGFLIQSTNNKGKVQHIIHHAMNPFILIEGDDDNVEVNQNHFTELIKPLSTVRLTVIEYYCMILCYGAMCYTDEVCFNSENNAYIYSDVSKPLYYNPHWDVEVKNNSRHAANIYDTANNTYVQRRQAPEIYDTANNTFVQHGTQRAQPQPQPNQHPHQLDITTLRTLCPAISNRFDIEVHYPVLHAIINTPLERRAEHMARYHNLTLTQFLPAIYRKSLRTQQQLRHFSAQHKITNYPSINDCLKEIDAHIITPEISSLYTMKHHHIHNTFCATGTAQLSTRNSSMCNNNYTPMNTTQPRTFDYKEALSSVPNLTQTPDSVPVLTPTAQPPHTFATQACPPDITFPLAPVASVVATTPSNLNNSIRTANLSIEVSSSVLSAIDCDENDIDLSDTDESDGLLYDLEANYSLGLILFCIECLYKPHIDDIKPLAYGLVLRDTSGKDPVDVPLVTRSPHLEALLSMDMLNLLNDPDVNPYTSSITEISPNNMCNPKNLSEYIFSQSTTKNATNFPTISLLSPPRNSQAKSGALQSNSTNYSNFSSLCTTESSHTDRDVSASPVPLCETPMSSGTDYFKFTSTIGNAKSLNDPTKHNNIKKALSQRDLVTSNHAMYYLFKALIRRVSEPLLLVLLDAVTIPELLKYQIGWGGSWHSLTVWDVIDIVHTYNYAPTFIQKLYNGLHNHNVLSLLVKQSPSRQDNDDNEPFIL